MSQSAYLIAQIDVKDLPQYLDQYGRPVMSQLTKMGAEILVASPHVETREGEWSGNWTVVIRFPSWETAIEWYESTDYAPFKMARISALASGGNVVFVRGRDSDTTK